MTGNQTVGKTQETDRDERDPLQQTRLGQTSYFFSFILCTTYSTALLSSLMFMQESNRHFNLAGQLFLDPEFYFCTLETEMRKS